MKNYLRGRYPYVDRCKGGFRVKALYHPGFDYPWEDIWHFALFASREDAERLRDRMGESFKADLRFWHVPAQVGCPPEDCAGRPQEHLEWTPRPPQET